MNRVFARKWMQLSAIWIIVALVPVGRVYLFDPHFIQAVFYIVILFLGLLLCPILMLWISFLQRKKIGWLLTVLIQIFLAVLISLLFYYVTAESSTATRMRTGPEQLRQMPVIKMLGFHLFSGNSYAIFTSLMMLCGLALLIEYNEALRQKTNSEATLKLRLLTSQIKALQSELQPHFLFNTLHAASSLMETDVDKAQQLIERLSFLLRSYLEIINRQFYSLAEEIDFLREYVEVQELRHNGVIELRLEIPDPCLQFQVPVILLQPVIENSVKHGWTDRTKPLLVSIRVETMDQTFRITICDNGSAVQQSDKTGIGIRNLNERLDVLYAGHFLYMEENRQGHCTIITLPLQP